MLVGLRITFGATRSPVSGSVVATLMYFASCPRPSAMITAVNTPRRISGGSFIGGINDTSEVNTGLLVTIGPRPGSRIRRVG